MPYAKDVDAIASLLKQNPTWNAIKPEHAARMRAQNKFKSGARPRLRSVRPACSYDASRVRVKVRVSKQSFCKMML